MARTISLLYDGVVDAEYTVTNPQTNDFGFGSGVLAPARFEPGVEVSATVLSEPTTPFTTEALTVATDPVFLDQVVAGFPVEIQPATYNGTPGAQVSKTLEKAGTSVLGGLSEANVYNVPAGTEGELLDFGETAVNNVVSVGTTNLIVATPTSISATIIAPEAPAITAQPQILGDVYPGGTITLVNATASGAPTPTYTLLLELDGVDVTADVVGTDYTIPPPTTIGVPVTLTTTATNSVGSDVTASTTENVVAAPNFLLEDYPGALVAWSLRNLTNTQPDVVRVWRDSDEQEMDFTAAEVEGTALLDFCGAGNGYIRTWYDQSGNDRHATRAGTAIMYQIVENGSLVLANGKPAIKGNPDAYLEFGSPVASDGFLVGAVPATATTMLGLAAVNVDAALYLAQESSTNSEFTRDVGNPTFYVNGALQSWANRGDVYAALDPSFIVAFSGASYPSSGTDNINRIGTDSNIASRKEDFNEIVLYGADQSANRAGIEQNQADYYGITLV